MLAVAPSVDTRDHRENQLDATFSALANPVRRAMLARLSKGEASVGELAEPFGLTLPAISRHVRVLERAGLIVQGQRAQYRPCALNPDPIREVAAWTEQYRAIWESSFDRLEGYLSDLQNPSTNEPSSEETP